jgi:hypothetical protein
LFCALLICFLSGCMSDKGHFDSQKDSSYNGTLKRVLIVSANNEASSRLGAGYRDSVANQLAIKAGISARSRSCSLRSLTSMKPVTP